MAAFARPVSLLPSNLGRPQSETTLEPLSARELEVVRLLATGATNAQIARTLVITINTTKKHLTNIFWKMGVSNRTQAATRARELGWLA